MRQQDKKAGQGPPLQGSRSGQSSQGTYNQGTYQVKQPSRQAQESRRDSDEFHDCLDGTEEVKNNLTNPQFRVREPQSKQVVETRNMTHKTTGSQHAAGAHSTVHKSLAASGVGKTKNQSNIDQSGKVQGGKPNPIEEFYQINFLCYHTCIPEFNKTFWLHIEYPPLPKEVQRIPMQKLTEDIVSVTIKIPKNKLTTSNKVEYYYALDGTARTYTCDKIVRNYKHMEMARFFDTPTKFAATANSYIMKDQMPLTRYINLAMSLFLYSPQSQLASPNFIQDIAEFYYIHSFPFHFPEMLRAFSQTLEACGGQREGDFTIYILKALYFTTSRWYLQATMKEYFALLDKLSSKVRHFQSLYDHVKSVDSQEGFLAFVEGAKKVLDSFPQAKLWFIDNRDLVPNAKEALEKAINSRTVDPLTLVKEINQLLRKRPQDTHLASQYNAAKDKLIKQLQSFDQLLDLFEREKTLFTAEDMKSAWNHLKNRAPSITQFVLVNFERIVGLLDLENLVKDTINLVTQAAFSISSPQAKKFLSDLIRVRQDAYLSYDFLERTAKSLKNREIFENFLHVFSLYQAPVLKSEKHVKLIELVLGFCFRSPDTFVVLKDVSTLRLSLENPRLYDPKIKGSIMKVVEGGFFNYCQTLSDKDVKDRLNAIKGDVIDRHQEYSREILTIYFGRVEEYLSKSFKNLAEAQQFLGSIYDPNTFKILNPFFEPLCKPIVQYVNSTLNGPLESIASNIILLQFARVDNAHVRSIKAFEPIRARISDFIRKLNTQELTLDQTKEVQQGKPLMNLLQAWLPHEISGNSLQQIQQSIGEFTQKMDFYMRSIEWISRYFDAMQSIGLQPSRALEEEYKRNLVSMNDNRERMTLKQLSQSKGTYDYFDSIKVLTQMQPLLTNMIFKRIYVDLVVELYKDPNAAQQNEQDGEAQQLPLRVAPVVTKDYFESSVSELLKKSKQIQMIKDYPNVRLLIKDVKRYYNVKGNISSDIEMIRRVFKMEPAVNEELVQHLKFYHKIPKYERYCQTLQGLEFLIKDKSTFSEPAYLTTEYLKMIKEQTEFTALQDIGEFSAVLQRIFKMVKGDQKVKPTRIEELEQISRSKELYDFALTQKDVNFNDLIERLDEGTNLSVSVINDMNSVTQFFLKLKQKLDIATDGKPFSMNILARYVHFFLQQETYKDMNFATKLRSCIESLHQLKFVTTATLNVSENTVKIIQFVMTRGKLSILREQSKFEFKIRYIDDGGVAHELPYDSIERHCNRSVLLVHQRQQSNVREGQDEEEKGEVQTEDLFAKQVRVFNSMIKLLEANIQAKDQLYLSGHFEEQEDMSIHVPDKPINIDEIIPFLEEDLQSSQIKLREWDEELLKAREKHYFLTYVPNQVLYLVLEFFKNPQNPKPQMLLNFFKLVDDRFDISLLDTVQKKTDFYVKGITIRQTLDKLGDYLNEIVKPEKNIQLNVIVENIPKNKLKVNEFKKNDSVYKCDNDVEQIKAIISIFNIFSIDKPQNWNLLICTPATVISDLKNFILRAKNLPLDALCPFIIADFQRLPLSIQVEAYEFYEKRFDDEYKQKAKSPLVILFNQQNNPLVIEQLGGRRQYPINMTMTPEEVKAFFSLHSKATVVISQGSGLGKSRYIKDTILKHKFDYQRIMLSGEMSPFKLYQLHKDKLDKRALDKCPGYHYDLQPTTHFPMILFQALILKTVAGNDEKILYFDPKSVFFIEIAESLTKDIITSIYQFLKIESKQFDINELDVSMDPNSEIQILAHFMALQEPIKKVDEFIKSLERPLPAEQIISMIDRAVSQKLPTPNFYLINSYINLVGDQLRRLCQSYFLNNDSVLEEQFSNKGQQFFNQIKDEIIKLSMEVTLQCKGLKEQSLALNNVSLEEEQMKRLEGLKWEQASSLFIILNDGGTILPVFKEPKSLPECMKLYYAVNKSMKEDMERLEDLKPVQVLERMSRIFGKDLDSIRRSLESRKIQIDRISFTRDNFLKLAFIYLRLRIGSSVIIMGETGVGKTAIINYLADVLAYDFRVLNLHEGISEEEILNFVGSAQAAFTEGEVTDKKIILFFDEINTNVHIDGLLKEIMVDRLVQGKPLHQNILLVAACNPYQFKNQKAIEDGAGEGVSAGLQHAEFKNKMSKLVYTVRPLPESFFMFLWDYGSLTLDEESTITRKIISSINLHPNMTEMGAAITEENINGIAKCICYSQAFIRRNEAKWAVSLRDVDRFKRLFCYFFKHNQGHRASSSKRKFSQQERAFVLSVCFCYYFRIQSSFLRKQFKAELKEHMKNLSYSFNDASFDDILKEEYKVYLDNIEIPPGIGKNTPLKENIFVIITCLMNQIPLFITGKPGSSKTLAINLVSKSMKGKTSQNEFFKELPALISFTYQGSTQSTSAGIKRIFDKAISHQADIDRNYEKERAQKGDIEAGKKTIVMVLFDEIGLAEVSPNNPLKVLHSLLEPPKVSVVGISNWSLDASKMNRGITLSRPDPEEGDLVESAESINEQIHQEDSQRMNHIQKTYLTKLARGYNRYRKEERTDFHGLRDFYSLIQSACTGLVHANNLDDFRNNQKALMNSIERNFGGEDTKVPLRYFCEELKMEDQLKNFQPKQTIEIVEQNIRDRSSRHLMLITKQDEEAEALLLVEGLLNKEKIEFKFFTGSDFREDQSENAAYNLINDIILCMERGISCVLVNLDIVYQSFYDMLNQNYQVVNGQRYCKVAIGADSTKTLVHENFRCVVIVSDQDAKKMDPPLLNRFEKQLFSKPNLSQTNSMHEQELIGWMTGIENKQGPQWQEADIFPVSVKKNLGKLIIQMSPQENEESLSDLGRVHAEGTVVDRCKRIILQMATLTGLIRTENQELIASANDRLDINSLIENRLSGQQQKNLMIYTYQLVSLYVIAKQHQGTLIDLQMMNSQRQFEEKVQNFFRSDGSRILFVFADSTKNSLKRIKLCKSALSSIFNKEITQGNISKRICFIVKLTDPKVQIERHACVYNPLWEEVMVEVLNGSGSSNVPLTEILRAKKLEDLFENKEIFLDIVDENFAPLISKIRYGLKAEKLSERIYAIKDQLRISFGSELHKYFLRLFKHQPPQVPKDWKFLVVKNPVLMNGKTTFFGVAMEYLSRLIIKYVSFIVAKMEENGFIGAFIGDSKCILTSQAVICFQKIFEAQYLDKLQMQTKGTPNDRFAITEFPSYSFDFKDAFTCLPFTRHLHGLFISLKSFYKESIGQIDIDDRMEERFQAIVPEYFLRLSLKKPEVCQAYLKQFPLLMDYELSSKNSESKIGELIMDFLKLRLKIYQDRNEAVNIIDYYLIYWSMEDLIQIMSRVLPLASPHIFEQQRFFQVMTENIADENEIDPSAIRFISNLLMPEIEVLKRCNQAKIDWVGRVSQIIAIIEEADTLSHLLPGAKEFKTLKFLINIAENIVCPFDLELEKVSQIYQGLNGQGLDRGVQYLIGSVFETFAEDLEKEGPEYVGLPLQFTKLIYDLLEQYIEQVENEEQLFGLARLVARCIVQDFSKYEESFSDIQSSMFSLQTKLMLKTIALNDIVFFSDAEQDLRLVSIFDEYLLGNEGLHATCEHPVAVLLTDAIETALYKNSKAVNREFLSRSLDELTLEPSSLPEQQTESLGIRTLVSLAHFRHAAKAMIGVFIKEREKPEADRTWEFGEEIDTIKALFNDKLKEGIRSQALMIYVFKLLRQGNVPVEEIIKRGDGAIFMTLMPWMTHLNILNLQTYKQYQIQISPDVTQQLISIMSDFNQLQTFLKAELTNPSYSTRELAIKQTLLQDLYFNSRGGIEQAKVAAGLVLGNCNRPKAEIDFMTNLINSATLPAQAKLGKEMLEKPKEGYMPELLTFVAICTFSSKQSSFLFKLFESIHTDQLKNYFIPFMPNTKDDVQYQTVFAADPNDKVRRWRCKNEACQFIFSVGNCGLIHHHRGGITSYDCPSCGKVVGQRSVINEKGITSIIGKENTVDVDSSPLTQAQLFEQIKKEAKTGYVSLEPSLVSVINIRGINNAVKLIGIIIVHSVFLIGLLYAPQGIMSKVCELLQIFEFKRQGATTSDEVYKHHSAVIRSAWSTLMQNHQLSNDHLLLIVEYIVGQLQMKQDAPDVQFGLLATTAGREKFETHFQQSIVPGFPLCVQDNFASIIASLSQNKKAIEDIVSNSIEEVVDIQKQEDRLKRVSYFTILRFQGQIKMPSFQQYIAARQDDDAKIIQITLHQSESFQFFHHLRPLLVWAQYVQKVFNRRVSKAQASDLTMIQVINECLPECDRPRCMELLKQFIVSWNELAKAFGVVGEECDTIELYKNLSAERSPFVYCCSNNNDKSSLGFHLFALLRTLSQRQNGYLEILQQQVQMRFKKVSLMQLKQDQIIRIGGNEFETFINDILVESTNTGITYGQGRNIHYNIERIAKKIQDSLISGLTEIDVATRINFEFSDSEEGNPFNQYYEIQTKVGYQERSEDTTRLIETLTSVEERTQVLRNVRLAMSFLEQTGGDKQKTLVEYMRAFNINTAHIEMFPNIRLVNVLDVFEQVENSLHSELIEKINPIYQLSLDPADFESVEDKPNTYDELKAIIQQLTDDDLEFLKLGLARLCIRQLSSQMQQDAQSNLFQAFLLEVNLYLFSINEDTEILQRMEALQNNYFFASKFFIGQAYSIYRELIVALQTRANDRIKNEEEQRKAEMRNKLLLDAERLKAAAENAGGSSVPISQPPPQVPAGVAGRGGLEAINFMQQAPKPQSTPKRYQGYSF